MAVRTASTWRATESESNNLDRSRPFTVSCPRVENKPSLLTFPSAPEIIGTRLSVRPGGRLLHLQRK